MAFTLRIMRIFHLKKTHHIVDNICGWIWTACCEGALEFKRQK